MSHRDVESVPPRGRFGAVSVGGVLDAVPEVAAVAGGRRLAAVALPRGRRADRLQLRQGDLFSTAGRSGTGTGIGTSIGSICA